MAPTELQKLRDAVAKQEATMLAIRKDRNRHSELMGQAEEVRRARNELKAYERSHE